MLYNEIKSLVLASWCELVLNGGEICLTYLYKMLPIGFWLRNL